MTKRIYFLTLSATALHCLLHKEGKKEKKQKQYREENMKGATIARKERRKSKQLTKCVWELLERTTGIRFTVATTQLQENVNAVSFL